MQKPNRRRRWLSGLLFLTLALLLSAVAAGWLVLRRTVPPLEGQLRLPGLAAPVEILFDAQAVPHIYARDSDDAWTALGCPHRAGYAEWRHAEARLLAGEAPTAVADTIRSAAASASGHVPLVAAIRALADRAVTTML